MKVKLDENLDVRLVDILAEQGVDARTVYSQNLSGAPDEDIYLVCRTEKRALITCDLDFSNPLRFPPANTSGIVVLRPRLATLPNLKTLLLQALPTLRKTGCLDGKLWIIELNRIRVYNPRVHEEK